MGAPTNTYDSNTELSLGQVPDVDDPQVYRALLDIHNAIENLLTNSDAGDNALASLAPNLALASRIADIEEQIGSGEELTWDDEGLTFDDTHMTFDRTES
jgi:hypothetical protein